MRIVEDGAPVREALTAAAALEILHMRLFGASLEDRPRATVLHAACLRRDGRRFLLVGSKGAGKSTLTIRLMRAGYEVEGDENVFVNHSSVIARPRGCRVREGALAQLADVAGLVSSQPCYLDHDTGERVFNCDPRALGSAAWKISEGRADAVFVLRPNHGGYSSVRPLQPSAMVQSLMSETGWKETGRGASVGNLVALATSASAFDLSLGDHPTALRCIEAALNE